MALEMERWIGHEFWKMSRNLALEIREKGRRGGMKVQSCLGSGAFWAHRAGGKDAGREWEPSCLPLESLIHHA